MMYSRTEERWNVITHGFGVLLSVAGLVILLNRDSYDTTISRFSIIVYGISLILLYSASTAYHLARKPEQRRLFRKLDHISIYYLIAGTYTPVTLLSLSDSSGQWMFYAVWAVALFGTMLKVFFTGRFERFSLILYLIMGWLVVFDLGSLIENQSTIGLSLLAVGGGSYTIGTIFYAVERIPYNHAIWHLFVLAGSVFHYFFILLDVI